MKNYLSSILANAIIIFKEEPYLKKYSIKAGGSIYAIH